MTGKQMLFGGSALAGVAAVVPALGYWRAHRAAARLFDELEAEDRAQHGFVRNRVSGVPDAVRRFFHRSLTDGQPLVRFASVTEDGEFALAPDAWRIMHARERFSTMPIGFVWEARIKTAPFAPTYVHDSYVHGVASMRGDLLGLYPAVNQTGTRELNEGALTRFLAEAVWFPTALLPGHGVSWMSYGKSSAVATLTDRGITVSARFRFNDEGDIVEIVVADRFRAVNGAFERTPWIVRCTDHQEHDGMRIPTRAEAAWQLAETLVPYWRGRVTEVAYQFEH